MNATQELQLKPCPFCGTPAIIECNSLGSWLVYCSRYNEGDQETDCPCCPELKSMHDTRESAIEAWNTRSELTLDIDAASPCVSCGKPSETSTADDADMCFECMACFQASEYDQIKKKLIQVLDKYRPDLDPEDAIVALELNLDAVENSEVVRVKITDYKLLEPLKNAIRDEFAGNIAEMKRAYPDGYAASMCREMIGLTLSHLANIGLIDMATIAAYEKDRGNKE